MKKASIPKILTEFNETKEELLDILKEFLIEFESFEF